MNKKQIEVVVTSYGRNKNCNDEIKENKTRPIIAPAIDVRLLKISLIKKTKRRPIIAPAIAVWLLKISLKQLEDD